VERFLAESCRYFETSQQLRNKFSAELEPLLLRDAAAVSGPPPEQLGLSRCGQTSGALRQLLDSQSSVCASVHSWRESVQKLTKLLDRKLVDDRDTNLSSVLNYSLSAASL
jgi:hypothetical protein